MRNRARTLGSDGKLAIMVKLDQHELMLLDMFQDKTGIVTNGEALKEALRRACRPLQGGMPPKQPTVEMGGSVPVMLNIGL